MAFGTLTLTLLHFCCWPLISYWPCRSQYFCDLVSCDVETIHAQLSQCRICHAVFVAYCSQREPGGETLIGQQVRNPPSEWSMGYSIWVKKVSQCRLMIWGERLAHSSAGKAPLWGQSMQFIFIFLLAQSDNDMSHSISQNRQFHVKIQCFSDAFRQAQGIRRGWKI